jgi:hypothetical protein
VSSRLGWIGSVSPRDEDKRHLLKMRRLGYSDGRAGRAPALRDSVYMQSYRRGIEARESQESE